jgi:DNA-binding SARP family transcriptional activator
MPTAYSSIALDLSETLPETTRLVVIHPNYAQLWQILNRYLFAEGTVYVRLSATESTVEVLLTQIHAAAQTQLEGGVLLTLVLDECDQLPLDVLTTLISAIHQQFLAGSDTRLILTSRVLPLEALNGVSDRASIQMIPQDEQLLLCDYIHRDEARPHLLEVQAFGNGHVVVNGKELTQWDGILPRLLFFYIVDRGMVTRNDIFNVFWPNLSVREATNVFHVTKRKVSEILSTDLTLFSSGYYHVAPNLELRYDVAEFTGLIHSSEVATLDEAARLLTRAILLYQGSFLKTVNLPWAENRRSGLRQMYSDALTKLASIAQEQAYQREAIGYYIRSLVITPEHPDHMQKIMRLYGELGLYREALESFEEYRLWLEHQHGLAPAHLLQGLAAEYRIRV